MLDSCAIFVCACKRYEWIYPYFYHFAVENLPFSFKFFDENDAGGGSWNERMIFCLNSLSEYRDVVYLQEDFLIKYVDQQAVERALDIHRKYKANITKLGNNYEFRNTSFPDEVCGLSLWLQDVND